jgi:hypothetical protein
MQHRNTLIALALAGAGMSLAAAPAEAVDSVSCRAGEQPHAGRQFTLVASTEPIVGDYRYRFDLDGDGSFETDTGTENRTRTEKTTPGTYTYGVVVTDQEAPADSAKREARATCEITVVNDLPTAYFEAHPVEEPFTTAYEATRFTFSGQDNEDGVEQRAMTHSIDFDGDGQFEFTARGDGEVFASFPAGWDKDVTHRLTDTAGGSVDTKIHVKGPRNAWGIGGDKVIAPLSTGPLTAVAAKAPKSIKRKTLLKKGVVATFTWGAAWGRVVLTPAVKKVTAYSFEGDAGYAPGQQVVVKPLPPQLKGPIKKGAKKLLLRWTAKGHEGPEKTGTLVVKITR